VVVVGDNRLTTIHPKYRYHHALIRKNQLNNEFAHPPFNDDFSKFIRGWVFCATLQLQIQN